MQFKFPAALVATVCAFTACADFTDIVWIGEAGADIGTKTNWSPQPSANLSSSSGSAYRLVFNGDATPVISEADKVYCAEIKVTEGNVAISRTISNGRFVVNNTTMDNQHAYIEVAEGAHLTIGSESATVAINNAGCDRIWVKKGGGTFTHYGELQNMNIGVEIEGVLETYALSVDGIHRRFNGGGNVLVKANSTLRFLSGASIEDGSVVYLEDGAVFDMNGCSDMIAAVSGTGIVRGGNLTMTLQGGPHTFSGHFENMTGLTFTRYATTSRATTWAEFGFILGAADTLADPGAVHVYVTYDSGCSAADKIIDDVRHFPIRFAPGIGEFYCVTSQTKETTAGQKVVIHKDDTNPWYVGDTNGAPIVLHTKIKHQLGESMLFCGPGDLVAELSTDSDAITLTKDQLGVTGKLSFGPAGKTVMLGDGTAANDFDLSKPAAIGADGATVVFNNSTAVNYTRPLFGSGGFRFNQAGTRVGQFNADGGHLSLTADTVIDGGRAELNYHGPTSVEFAQPNLTLTVNGGNFFADKTVSSYEPDFTLLPRGMLMNGDHQGSATLTVNGGDVAIRDNYSYGPRIKNLNGGRLHLAHGQAFNPSPASVWTAETPNTYNFNGGELVVSVRDRTSSNTAIDVFPDEDRLLVNVDDGGAAIDDEHVYNSACSAYTKALKISKPIVATGTGGWAQRTYLDCWYKYALPISGTFTGIGGSSVMSGGAEPDGSCYFGSGDMLLRNHVIDLSEIAEISAGGSYGFCPHGEGGKLTIGGVGALNLRASNSSGNASVNIDRLDFEAGGVFYLFDFQTVGLDGTGSTVKLGSAPALASSGRTLMPIFSKSRLFHIAKPMTYDEEHGLMTMNTFSSSFGEDKVMLIEGRKNISENDIKSLDALLISQGSSLAIGEGSLLMVGDGVNNGVISMGKAEINGTGSISFGGGMGYVLCDVDGNNVRLDCYSAIRAPIIAANGLSIVSYPDIASTGWRGVKFAAANTYSGSTYINSALVQAEHANCFSTGDVYLGEGKRFGGSVRFACEGGVWHNNFHADGLGIRQRCWNIANQYETSFAMGFSKNGEVAGNVILGRCARMSTSTNVVRGVISGTVSGGKLEIYQTAGEIVLKGHNTYTGGTDVINGALILGHADSAGTGPIYLDHAAIGFDNEEDIVFTTPLYSSKFEGVAQYIPLRIEGEGKVELACEMKDAQFLYTEFGKGRHKIAANSSLPLPFQSVEGSSFRDRAILVFDEPVTYHLTSDHLTGDFEIELRNGAKIDLGDPTGQATYSILRFTGDPADVINGRFLETRPRGEGSMMIIK